MLVAISSLLSGCCITHDWQEATCTTPKICGETEGKALEHNLSEATYQSPVTCTVCGAIDGEPLKPYFEEKGLVCGGELNVHYPYVSSCYRNKEILTTGEVFFTDYQVFDSTEEYEALAGYEWKSCIVNYIFDDDNAWNHGYDFGAESSDYYTGIINDSPFTINYDGKDYPDCELEATILENEWNSATRVATARMEVAIRVPVGYDGIVISTHNRQIYDKFVDQQDIKYFDEIIDENTVFFRLD